VLRLFDQYVHGLIDRRGFIERAGRVLASVAAATAALEALNPRFAEAEHVPPNDPHQDRVRRAAVTAWLRQAARLPDPTRQRRRQTAGGVGGA